MRDIVFIFLISGISFLFAWLIQQMEIEHLKGLLQLEKSKVEFYKNKKETIKN